MINGFIFRSLPTLPATSYPLTGDVLCKFLEALQQQSPFMLQRAKLFYMYAVDKNASSLAIQLDNTINNGGSSSNMSVKEYSYDYLPVKEITRRLVLLLRYPLCNGVVNICSGKPISVRFLVEKYLAKLAAEIHLNLRYYQYPGYEPIVLWGDSSRFNRMTSGSRSYMVEDYWIY